MEAGPLIHMADPNGHQAYIPIYPHWAAPKSMLT